MSPTESLARAIPATLALFLTLPSAAGDYPVVDTGQTQCYDAASEIAPPVEGAAFYGQDAQYDGNQPSYTLSGDGLTVYDGVTGLTWMASPDGDADGVLESPDDKMSWWDAMDYPGTLNAQSFAGYDDWRLPSIKELYSLIDFSGLDPSGPNPTNLVPFIDTDYFEFVYGDESQGERIIDSQYWTTTEYVWTTMGGNHTVFGVNFADGRIKGYPTSFPEGGYKLNFALCCRGNANYGINEFTDNGDGTVTDEATGLMWQQNDSEYGMTWEDALAYAEGLELAGHDDWRLPNAKELQSIVDYTRSPDYTSSAAIDSVLTCTEITNETLASDFPWYWSGTTHANESPTPGRAGAYVCFGRGMGYMMGSWLDVHGAGCQRSDPKDGDLSDYTYVPYGYYFGSAPQGDAIRIYNYVRCVRDSGESGVDDGGSSDAVGSLRYSPNPFQDSTELTLSLPSGVEDATCVIHTVSGRAIRTLNATASEGEARFEWDGTSDSGERVAAGVYFAELSAGELTSRARLVLLR